MDALVFLAVWFGVTFLLVGLWGRRAWRGSAGLLRLYLVTGWALVAVGVLQVLVTPNRFRELSESALWFCASGFLVAFTGAFNLLNLDSRVGQPSLRRVCALANGVVTIFFVAIATHRGAEPLHDPVSGVMIVASVLATALGVLRESRSFSRAS